MSGSIGTIFLKIQKPVSRHRFVYSFHSKVLLNYPNLLILVDFSIQFLKRMY